MKINIKTKSAIFPMPVLLIATYNEDGSVNVMNAAWGMMIDRDIIALNLTSTHKTVQNIKKNGAFTISLATSKHVVEADYFGVVSGNKVDNKLEKAGLSSYKSNLVNAPIINEFPISIECEFIEFQDDEYGIGVVGKILNVLCDEECVKDGCAQVSLIDAIAYDPFTHGYYKIGERIGNGFKDGFKIK